MCNVSCKIQAISISLIEELVQTESENEVISIREIVNLDPDIIIPEEFILGKIPMEALKRFLKVKKVLFSSQKETPIRELEALRDGWFLEDYWFKGEVSTYLFLNYPGIRIDYKLEEKIRNIFFYAHKLKAKAEAKNIDSRAPEIIEELKQLEQIFYSYPNIKLFPDDLKIDFSVKFSCLRYLQLEIEKLAPAVIDIEGSYVAGKKVVKTKEITLPISDYLFIKGLLAKIMDLADYIG